MKLHNLISKLKKWIKILEAKTKQLPKFFLIEEKCRFLSNFSAQTAEVEIPGEFLMPKPTHYYIKIARSGVAPLLSGKYIINKRSIAQYSSF